MRMRDHVWKRNWPAWRRKTSWVQKDPRLVPKGRWLLYLMNPETGEMHFFVGGEAGLFLRITPDRSEAWYLDQSIDDEEATRLFGVPWNFFPKEVLMLEDVERHELFEFKGFGFRLLESRDGGSS